MKQERTIDFYEKQLELAAERERCFIEQIRQLSEQNTRFSGQIDQLTVQLNLLTVQITEHNQTITSLQEALLQKNSDISTLTGKNHGLSKLLSNTSEKITPPSTQGKEAEKKPYSPKARGNNGARRKEHFNLEEEIIDIWPDDPGFDKAKAIELPVTESIRYVYIPPRFIKRIFKQHNCVIEGKMYYVSAPRTPLMNSRYEASFIAGLFQLRYIYSMPVERIVKYFDENGFEPEKPTAHFLIGKTAIMLDCFYVVLRRAIHSDPYIRLDETYHCILNEGINKKGKATRKGYLRCAMADNLQPVQFFYKDGSRGKEVFDGYLDKSYCGAVHSDGLQCYKAIETDLYPNAIFRHFDKLNDHRLNNHISTGSITIRISCIQHAKRKFLDVDIEKDEQAKEIVDIINQLYQTVIEPVVSEPAVGEPVEPSNCRNIEHKMLPEWDNVKKLEYRNEEATPVLDTLKDKLLLIQKDPATLPSTPLSTATNYLLNEFDAIKNYLLDVTYTLDNNPIERTNRYISLNRRNSLFFGSHKGAERSALLFSLACSCRLHKINTFEYFTDILTRMAYWNTPNPSYEVLRELLPDRWKKADPEIYSDA